MSREGGVCCHYISTMELNEEVRTLTEHCKHSLPSYFLERVTPQVWRRLTDSR